MSLRFALWSLKNRPGECLVVEDVLRCGTAVVHAPFSELVLNGYVRVDMTLTEVGFRLAPLKLNHITQRNALAAMSRGDRFILMPECAIAANGSGVKISRYVADVLVFNGKLVIDTGGYLVRPRHRVTLTFSVFYDEVESVNRLVKQCSPSSRILMPAPETL